MPAERSSPGRCWYGQGGSDTSSALPDGCQGAVCLSLSLRPEPQTEQPPLSSPVTLHISLFTVTWKMLNPVCRQLEGSLAVTRTGKGRAAGFEEGIF